ncbi:MAG: VWA domain-containing protein [Gammaproteobacteria bacterium]|nr:VWA domain-containing protein [Gammaproteobacteria bacterium]
MNALHFFKPELLWLLPFCLLPLISYGVKQFSYSGLEDWPKDRVSDVLRWLVRLMAVVTLASLIIAAAAPFTEGGTQTRTGKGAEIVIVLDRSGSMAESLEEQDPVERARGKMTLSRIAASREVLLKLMDQRPGDTFGVVVFNASPIAVAPLSADRELARAALKSAEGNSSGFTALHRALEMGLDYFKDRPYTATRLILLVSDGDTKIKDEDKEILKQRFKDYQAELMWIYVHTGYDFSLQYEEDITKADGAVDPNVALNQLFLSLGMPYQAFEVNSEAGLQRAVAEIGRATNKPTRYVYRLPRQDYAVYFYILAMGLFGILFWLKHIEIKVWRK